MADRAISELIAANQVTPTDLFVLEQSGTAKKLPGHVLLNWLTAAADGHGGIQSIVKESTSGLVDTYKITLADTTTFDFLVTNGKSIESITKESTSGLVDTYRIRFNDNTSQTYTITNGEKGDKGDNQYVWIKYASQKPTEDSHSFGDVADNWIGVYSGESETAPSDWTLYEWFEIKGEKGDTGSPATLTSSKVEYQVGTSGTIIPSGTWSESVPTVPQASYLWTKTTVTFNTGDPIILYSVSRMGIDGLGSVTSVNDVSPDENGNVVLDAEDVGALSNNGGIMGGSINMNGQTLFGLNAPTANDHAANMGYVNEQVKKAVPRNFLDNSDFTNPVNQRGSETYTGDAYSIDRWYGRDNTTVIETGDNGITLYKTESSSIAPAIRQKVANAAKLAGKTLTLVCRNAENSVDTAIRVYNGTSQLGVAYSADSQGSLGYALLTLTIPESISDGALVVQVGSNAVTANTYARVKNIALYEGEYTAETLPAYQPKGYTIEVAECMRYFQNYATRLAVNALPVDTTRFVFSTFAPCSMRVLPTITFNDGAGTGGLYQGPDSGGTDITADQITAVVDSAITKGSILSATCTLSKEHGKAAYREAMVRLPAFQLSADL